MIAAVANPTMGPGAAIQSRNATPDARALLAENTSVRAPPAERHSPFGRAPARWLIVPGAR